MGSGHLAPDNSHLRLVGAPGNAGLVLGLVHVGTPLANVPPGTEEIEKQVVNIWLSDMWEQFQIPRPIERGGKATYSAVQCGPVL